MKIICLFGDDSQMYGGVTSNALSVTWDFSTKESRCMQLRMMRVPLSPQYFNVHVCYETIKLIFL